MLRNQITCTSSLYKRYMKIKISQADDPTSKNVVATIVNFTYMRELAILFFLNVLIDNNNN